MLSFWLSFRVPGSSLQQLYFGLNLEENEELNNHRTSHFGCSPRCSKLPWGSRVDLYLCLAHELEVAPLRAWRRGTWLGHLFFRVETDLGEIGFTPIPLDDEKRQLLGLSLDTLRYADIEGPLDPEQGDNAIVLYVDEELLARAALAPTTSAAKAFQAQLFLDAMTAVVYTASADMTRSPQDYGALVDIDGSIYDRILDRVAGTDKHSKEIFFEKTRSSPTLVLAHIEGLLSDLRKNLGSILTGGQQ